jgi:hypothetical protein
VISAALATLVLGWAVLLQRRLAHAAEREHELRGALNVLGLAVHRCGDRALTAAYEGQLRRVRWVLGETVPRDGIGLGSGAADVVLGNLVANAAEHGDGPATVRIEVVNRRPARSVALFVRHRGQKAPLERGRGLRIARRAARAAGGRLDVRDEGGRFAAVVELPVER